MLLAAGGLAISLGPKGRAAGAGGLPCLAGKGLIVGMLIQPKRFLHWQCKEHTLNRKGRLKTKRGGFKI